jgi:hypothetical protein
MKEFLFSIFTFTLLLIPFPAFSMDLMDDSEMDSVTGMAVDGATMEFNTDQAVGSSSQGSVVVGVESNAEQDSKNLVQGMTVTHGVEIYVYDVSFDLHIMNISGGGVLAAEDMLLF